MPNIDNFKRKKFSGIGIDISKKCLNLAKINRDNFALEINQVFKIDIDNFNYGKYDLIISNILILEILI